MNINYYLSYSHFLIAYPLEDFRARRVSGTALVQEIRFQFLFLKGFLGFFLYGGDIPEYFYELCRILPCPTGSSIYKQGVKILSNATHQ